MHPRRTGIVVTLVALAVAVVLKLFVIRVETITAPSAENTEPQDIDKTKHNIRTQLVPFATGSAEGGLQLLCALNDNDIGAEMQGNRSVTVYVMDDEKSEAVRVLGTLGRKDIWAIREDSLTPGE